MPVSVMTPVSVRVVTSPTSRPFVASRRSRRMILPERAAMPESSAETSEISVRPTQAWSGDASLFPPCVGELPLFGGSSSRMVA